MNEKNSERIRLIALSGMFAAMITVMTTFIRIPASHNGYTHAGDSMIYLAAMVLPAPFAAAASSVGGFMADILAGAPEWAFATAIIKAINTLPFIAVRYYLKKLGRDNRIISPYSIAMLIPTSLVTIVGYYIAEGLMFGFEAYACRRKSKGENVMSEKKDEILYTYKSNVYLNITNACPCNCEFCIRRTTDTVGESSSLWLSHNPSFEDVKAAIDSFDFTDYTEAVFCGYGEPTASFDVLIKTAKYLRQMGIKTRLNTNGLGNLIHKRDITKEICDNIDFISISMNESDAKKYDAIVHPVFGIKSFDTMLDHARFRKIMQKIHRKCRFYCR